MTRACTHKFVMSALPPKADIVRHGGNQLRGDRSQCGEAARAIAEAVIRSVELIVTRNAAGSRHPNPVGTAQTSALFIGGT
jgi:hypothetical protein